MEGQRLLREGDAGAALEASAEAFQLDPRQGHARLGYTKANFATYGFPQSRIDDLAAHDPAPGSATAQGLSHSGSCRSSTPPLPKNSGAYQGQEERRRHVVRAAFTFDLDRLRTPRENG